MDRGYQHGFSGMHRDAMYNLEKRKRKAYTIARVLSDFVGESQLNKIDALDVGASTGIMDASLSTHLGSLRGIDIDEDAVAYAREFHSSENLKFQVGDAMDIDFPEHSFDIAICAQVYEHVPNAEVMMNEIYRVLKPGGICYFAAGNRLAVKEPHYNLPFLSVIPKPMAHLYMRIAGKGSHYYETHRSYWGLLRLVRKFELIDYTKELVEDPARFGAGYMIRPDSRQQFFAKIIAKYAYWLMPGYIWLLRKPVD